MSEFINTADVIGDEEMCDQIIMRTVTEYKENRISTVGQYAFYGCTTLTEVDVPNVTSIGQYAFASCKNNVLFVRCPNATLAGSYQFRDASSLVVADILGFEGSSWDSFLNCTSLSALILRRESLCPMSGTNMVGNTPIAKGTGYVYIPRSLVDSYKSATNWSTYANQIRAIEDYTHDGTVTGSFFWCSGIELDKTTLTFDTILSQTLIATLTNPSPFGLDFVKWSSADTSVAIVSNNGVVSPTGKGTTTITAECNGHIATCEVVVNTEITNILAGIKFNAGYISNNGSVTTSGNSDVYTDKFRIDQLTSQQIVVNLIDTKSTASNSRIVYYRQDGSVCGYTTGTAGTNKVVITSTVPSDTYYAAISINKSNGFSGIEITYSGTLIGQISY